jgi:hypothetical protein
MLKKAILYCLHVSFLLPYYSKRLVVVVDLLLDHLLELRSTETQDLFLDEVTVQDYVLEVNYTFGLGKIVD